eukprot:CAMPEP_0171178574 /NCGR_PEP_ID=MMETSP0790-20130122/12819_1 /TAXON_ID=2925 /ORGANISM="Alexandrium catenella, Strain OF101" /LENGTH=64 /DNA_ID=CAMNT_0011643495 /DNA_START=6 /DNA_END=200 /DNA_ORIENTATION=+
MDTANPNAEKLEFGVVERVQGSDGKQVRFRMLKDTEVNKLMADAAPKEAEEGGAAGSGAAPAAS